MPIKVVYYKEPMKPAHKFALILIGVSLAMITVGAMYRCYNG